MLTSLVKTHLHMNHINLYQDMGKSASILFQTGEENGIGLHHFLEQVVFRGHRGVEHIEGQGSREDPIDGRQAFGRQQATTIGAVNIHGRCTKNWAKVSKAATFFWTKLG